jgi:chromate transporter
VTGILSLARLFFLMFRIGLIGLGGGYAIVSIIMTELENLGVSVEQFADLTAVDLIVPGPLAINAATYVGYINAGFIGALVATLGISLPAYAIVFTVMYFLDKFKKSRLMQGLLAGIRPVAIGLIAAAALTIAGDVILRETVDFRTFFLHPLAAISPVYLLLFILAAFALLKLKANPILVTVLAGIAGAILAA